MKKTRKLRIEDCGLSTLHPTTTITTTTTTMSSYLKMDLKSDFFDFFQPICFWKAETKLEMNDMLNQTKKKRVDNLQYRTAKVVTGPYHLTSQQRLNTDLGCETIN